VTEVLATPLASRKVTGLPDPSRKPRVNVVGPAKLQRSSWAEIWKVVGTFRWTGALPDTAVGESTWRRRGARLAVTRNPAELVDQALSASLTARKVCGPSASVKPIWNCPRALGNAPLVVLRAWALLRNVRMPVSGLADE